MENEQMLGPGKRSPGTPAWQDPACNTPHTAEVPGALPTTSVMEETEKRIKTLTQCFSSSYNSSKYGHSFNKCLLSSCNASLTVLGTGVKYVNKYYVTK